MPDFETKGGGFLRRGGVPGYNTPDASIAVCGEETICVFLKTNSTNLHDMKIFNLHCDRFLVVSRVRLSSFQKHCDRKSMASFTVSHRICAIYRRESGGMFRKTGTGPLHNSKYTIGAFSIRLRSWFQLTTGQNNIRFHPFHAMIMIIILAYSVKTHNES